MYKTNNWEIVFPLKKVGELFKDKDVIFLPDGKPMSCEPENSKIYKQIEDAWCEYVKESLPRGERIDSSLQYRISGYEINVHNQLLIRLGSTDYRQMYGTNHQVEQNPKLLEEMLKEGNEKYKNPDAFFSNNLTMCTSVETKDGQYVVGLRSDKVAEYPNTWHVIGGAPRPIRYRPTQLKITDAMQMQLETELGIDSEEIEDISITGFVRNKRNRRLEVTFSTKLYTTFEELIRKKGIDHWEHKGLYALPDLRSLIEFLKENQKGFAMPAGIILENRELSRIKEENYPDNYHFVPSGEAALVLMLSTKDIDIETELPYLERN